MNAEGWLDRAFESLQAAEMEAESMQISGNVSSCLFSMQQAIEKALKGIIVAYDGNLDSIGRTHDIGVLVDAVRNLGYTDIPESISSHADEISTWEGAARYCEYTNWTYGDIYVILNDIDDWLRELRADIG